jgi:hypothetical protein
MPGAGAASSADAPPDNSSSKRSRASVDAATARARRPASSLPAVGSGCPAAIASNGAAAAVGFGATIRPVTIR